MGQLDVQPKSKSLQKVPFTPPPAESEELAPNSNKIDQVRNILFGTQLREQEMRLTKQEEKFLREIKDLKKSLAEKIENLENCVRSEINEVLEKVLNESEVRADHLKNLSATYSGEVQSIQKKMASFEKQTLRAHKELRDLLLERTNGNAQKTIEVQKKLEKEFNRELADLNHSKVDRNLLAGIFSEFVCQLNPDVPGGEIH